MVLQQAALHTCWLALLQHQAASCCMAGRQSNPIAGAPDNKYCWRRGTVGLHFQAQLYLPPPLSHLSSLMGTRQSAVCAKAQTATYC